MSRLSLIVTLIIFIAVIGSSVYAYESFTNTEKELTNTFKDINSSEQNTNYLQQNGLNGTAVIKSATQTNTWVNNNPQVDFTLKVTVPGKSPYEANCSQVIPQMDIPQYQPGAKVYVLVDPKNPQNLMLS